MGIKSSSSVGATARGGPWPPLQYASRSLGPLLCLSFRLHPSFSGPWTRHPAISFLVFLFVLLHTAFRTESFWDCCVLHSFYMPKPSYSLAFNKPDNVLSLNYGFQFIVSSKKWINGDANLRTVFLHILLVMSAIPKNPATNTKYWYEKNNQGSFLLKALHEKVHLGASQRISESLFSRSVQSTHTQIRYYVTLGRTLWHFEIWGNVVHCYMCFCVSAERLCSNGQMIMFYINGTEWAKQ